MYAVVPQDETVSQGDVIAECPVFLFNERSDPVDLAADPMRLDLRVIMVSQACDIAQAKVSRVVVAIVHEAKVLVEQGVLKAQTVRDQVRRGQAWGWHFLPASKDAPAFPESIVDLRDLHTVSKRVLERLIADGKRVCRVVTPFREHLAQHFAVTYMRIGLPEPYATEP